MLSRGREAVLVLSASVTSKEHTSPATWLDLGALDAHAVYMCWVAWVLRVPAITDIHKTGGRFLIVTNRDTQQWESCLGSGSYFSNFGIEEISRHQKKLII